MSIRDEIKAMSIAALKARDAETRSRLGGILSRFGEVEKGKGFDGWSEERERAVVASYVKQLKGALGDMAGTDLAAAYQAEIDLLAPFLPQLLDEAATRELVAPLAEQARSIGQFMGLVMRSHKGQVDPGLVRRIGQDLGLK